MKTTLQLSGLHCGNCVKSVENALNVLPTVMNVQIELATQIAVIEGDIAPQLLNDEIENLGFEASLQTV